MFGDGEKPVFKGKSENCMVQKVRLFDEIFKAWGVSERYKTQYIVKISKKSGLTQSVVARVESGTHSPTMQTMIKYLHAIGHPSDTM